MKEYWMTSEPPKVVTDVQLRHMVMEKKLNIGAVVHLDMHAPVHLQTKMFKVAREKLAHVLGSEILDNKVVPQFVNAPFGDYVKGEVIVMTESDLFELLGDLGIKVHVLPK